MNDSQMKYKICPICKIEKPYSEFGTAKNDRGYDRVNFKCKECAKAWFKNYYNQKMKDETYRKNRNEKKRQYNRNNHESISITTKKYYINNSINIRSNNKKYVKKQVETLDANYVLRMLVRGHEGVLKVSDIPKDLIELKKQQILLKRTLKLKNDGKSN